MSKTRTPTAVGRYLPRMAAGVRPDGRRELMAFGGARLFRGKAVLDIGSGDGRLALAAAEWADDVVGVDPDPEVIRAARANARSAGIANACFVVAPAQRLPFRDGAFDVVILSWVL